MKIARTVAFVFLVATAPTIGVDAYPSGAPVGFNSLCDTLVPGHGVSAQNTKSPYSIVPSSEKYIPGQGFSVTIEATESTTYKGILMQMRRKDNDAILGTWDVSGSENFKTVSCNGIDDNAVTHANSIVKGTNVFIWTAPPDSNADVYIIATFVKDFATFWVNQASSTIAADI